MYLQVSLLLMSMGKNILIRAVSLSETAALVTVSRDTFIAAFADTNTAEDMNTYLEQHLSASILAAEQLTSGTSFYFAEEDGSIVGYLKLNSGGAQKEAAGDNSMEIERIYILPSHWRKGVGQQLLDFAINTAKDSGIIRIWLGVWEHNDRALAFYQRNGFETFGQHPFVLGTDEQTDLLLQRMIS